MFEPLAFIAEVTQHIPEAGQHLIHYYGWYSNKRRGLRKAAATECGRGLSAATASADPIQPSTGPASPAAIVPANALGAFENPQTAAHHPGLLLPRKVNVADEPEVKLLLERIIGEVVYKPPGHELAAKACLLELLVFLQRRDFRKQPGPKQSHQAVAVATRFLESHYSRPPPKTGGGLGGPLAPQLQFSAASYSFAETATNAVIVITRTGDTNGALLFAPGDVSQRVQVPLLPDAFGEGPESFHLQLLAGVPAIVEIIITDDGP